MSKMPKEKIDQLKNRLVRIGYSEKVESECFLGTGVVYPNKENWYVLTAAHVLKDIEKKLLSGKLLILKYEAGGCPLQYQKSEHTICKHPDYLHNQESDTSRNDVGFIKVHIPKEAPWWDKIPPAPLFFDPDKTDKDKELFIYGYPENEHGIIGPQDFFNATLMDVKTSTNQGNFFFRYSDEDGNSENYAGFSGSGVYIEHQGEMKLIGLVTGAGLRTNEEYGISSQIVKEFLQKERIVDPDEKVLPSFELLKNYFTDVDDAALLNELSRWHTDLIKTYLTRTPDGKSDFTAAKSSLVDSWKEDFQNKFSLRFCDEESVDNCPSFLSGKLLWTIVAHKLEEKRKQDGREYNAIRFNIAGLDTFVSDEFLCAEGTLSNIISETIKALCGNNNPYSNKEIIFVVNQKNKNSLQFLSRKRIGRMLPNIVNDFSEDEKINYNIIHGDTDSKWAITTISQVTTILTNAEPEQAGESIRSHLQEIWR